MERDQKVLKLFIRLMLPVFALGGFGGVWGLALIGMNQEKTITGIWSSDKHYRATVVLSSVRGSCGDGTGSLVVVERQTFILKTGEFTPFCFSGSPDRISLRWQDDRTLSIGCSGCEEDYGYADQNWGKLRFSYDLDKP